MHSSVEPYSQKCGSNKPNFSFVAIVYLLVINNNSGLKQNSYHIFCGKVHEGRRKPAGGELRRISQCRQLDWQPKSE